MVSLNPGSVNLLAGGAPSQAYSSGGLYPPNTGIHAPASGAISANILCAIPFFARRTHAFSGMSIYQNGAGTTGNIRLGVYANTGGRPAALFQDVGAVACPASTGWRTVSATVNLVSGTWYWLAAVGDAAVVCYRVNTASSAENYRVAQEFGATSLLPPTLDLFAGFVGSHAYAALPDPFPTITDFVNNQFCPLPFMQG